MSGCEHLYAFIAERFSVHIYFSTVVRMAPVREGGELIRLNWDTKQIEARVPIYPENPELLDTNPRGNTRGGRGVALVNGSVIVASYHTLKILDHQLNRIHDITHPLMVNLHEVCVSGSERLLVSCTSIDAVLEVDLTNGKITREYWPREEAVFQQTLGIPPLSIDKHADNRLLFLSRAYMEDPGHLHINAVTQWNGQTFALCHSLGAVLNLGKCEIELCDPGVRGGHNLIVSDDEILINDTREHRILIYNHHTRSIQQQISLEDYPEIRAILQRETPSLEHKQRIAQMKRTKVVRTLKKVPAVRQLKQSRFREVLGRLGLTHGAAAATPLFVRGLDIHDDDIFVGCSPGTVAQINRTTGQILDIYRFSEDVRVCIHSLKIANLNNY